MDEEKVEIFDKKRKQNRAKKKILEEHLSALERSGFCDRETVSEHACPKIEFTEKAKQKLYGNKAAHKDREKLNPVFVSLLLNFFSSPHNLNVPTKLFILLFIYNQKTFNLVENF